MPVRLVVPNTQPIHIGRLPNPLSLALKVSNRLDAETDSNPIYSIVNCYTRRQHLVLRVRLSAYTRGLYLDQVAGFMAASSACTLRPPPDVSRLH